VLSEPRSVFLVLRAARYPRAPSYCTASHLQPRALCHPAQLLWFLAVRAPTYTTPLGLVVIIVASWAVSLALLRVPPRSLAPLCTHPAI